MGLYKRYKMFDRILKGDNMKIYNIKLQEGQLNNLKVFLDRVSLKGNEVMEFLVIQQALQQAEEIKEGD